MNEQKISAGILRQISRHYRSLGLKYFIKGLPYERCAELAYVIEYLEDRFCDNLRYLDIGTGESPLPTFLLKNTKWDILCVDKFSSVRKQAAFASRAIDGSELRRRFRIIEEDFLATNLPPASFDIITNISVIEHFEGELDRSAIEASGRLLRPGGLYILTTLINDGFPRDFFLRKEVYGVGSPGTPVFYQRHYDLDHLRRQVVEPSGLQERSRLYFGDYGFQCFETVFQGMPKVLRLFFQWATPAFARKFLSYRDHPVSRRDMKMNTASGVILVLTRP